MRALILALLFITAAAVNAQTSSTAGIASALRGQQGVDKSEVLANAFKSGEVRVLGDSMLVDRQGNILGLTQKKEGRAVDFNLTDAGTPRVLCAVSAMKCAQDFDFNRLPTLSKWTGRNRVDALTFESGAAAKEKPLCRKTCKTRTKMIACPTPQQPEKMCKQEETFDCDWGPCATGAVEAAMKASVAPVRVRPVP